MNLKLNSLTIDKGLLILIAFTSFDKKLFPLPSSTLMSIILGFLIIRSFLNKDKLCISTIEKRVGFFFWVVFMLLLIQFFYVSYTSMLFEFSKSFIIGIITVMALKLLLKSKSNIIFFLKAMVLAITFISFATVVSQVLFGTYGIKTILIQPYRSLQMPRSIGLNENPNYYSISLLIGVGVILGLFEGNFVTKKMWYILAFSIISIDLIMTFSRGAIIAYIFTLVYYILLRFNVSISLKKIVYSMGLLMLILIIGVFLNYTMQGRLYEFDVFSQIQSRFIGKGLENESRIIIWRKGWKLFTSSALFFSVGVGGKNFETFSNFGLDMSVHNSYLRYLYELGIVGFIALSFFLITLWKKSVHRFVHTKNPMFFALLIIMIFALSNDVLYLYEFWILVATIIYWESSEKLRYC